LLERIDLVKRIGHGVKILGPGAKRTLRIHQFHLIHFKVAVFWFANVILEYSMIAGGNWPKSHDEYAKGIFPIATLTFEPAEVTEME
jgi:hypothetical protein